MPFALTILLSAFLLFLIQPLIAKEILPWFGGGPGIWTTCMLFFQTLLLAGYAYAHLVIRRLGPRTQMMLHVMLLIAAILLLPVTPAPDLKPDAADHPALRILLLLFSSVGLQYFVLATTAPLLQAWFSRAISGYSAYRLYALSNVGSIIALAAYPFVVEPALTLRAQETAWSWGFALFAAASGACAYSQWRRATTGDPAVEERREIGRRPVDEAEPSWGVKALWFALAAGGSVMLLAVTNHVCQDIAVIPLLWVVPLVLYLLTFAICFDRERWYFRRFFAFAFVIAVAMMSVTLHHLPQILTALEVKSRTLELRLEIGVFLAALFICCMVCHGELARLKPASRYLTSFYLLVSAGGAAGGLFVALVAPFLFDIFLELHLGILLCATLALVAWFRDRTWSLARGRPRWAWICLVVGLVVLGESLRRHAAHELTGPLVVTRNFYGVVRIVEREAHIPRRHRYILQQSGMTEGLQFSSERMRRIPTSYYGRRSGVGAVFSNFPAEPPLHVGAIGLGVGTVATYGRDGDTFRFYDINPAIVDLARTRFTYLDDSPATITVVLGDARIALEREPPQNFDLLVLDAFGGDAIPLHLLTQEAFEIYLRQLKPDGVLAVHTSNDSLDLTPVIATLAEHFELDIAWTQSRGDQRFAVVYSEWFLLTRNAAFLKAPAILAISLTERELDRRLGEYGDFRIWSDNYSNLLQVLYD